MQKVFKLSLFALVVLLFTKPAFAQVTSDTTIRSIDADLINLFTQKTPKKYKIASVKVTGNRFFDENLLISIANLNIGDEVTIPGGDNFSKAITKLWSQNYFSDVEIYITRVEGKDIDIEVAVTERPRLSNFYFKGIPKGQSDEIRGKTGLVPNRVVTENMKITATEVIKNSLQRKDTEILK
jgi:outer membrane protein insertion porin family